MADQAETIFETETSSDQNEQQPTETTDDFQSKYVGEGKKYATVEDAMKALDHSQTHISTLETENEDLRKIEQRENAVSDILAQIEAKKGDNATAGVDLSEVEKLFDSKLDAREQQTVMTSNIKSVDSQMKAMFGDKAKDEMIAKGKTLGLSLEQMQNTASRSPQAFMAWFGAKETIGTATIKSDVDTQRLEETTVIKEGTYKHYQKLFKANPALRTDSNVQIEMINQATKLGDSFYD